MTRDGEECEPKPTKVMRRDDLLELVNATTPASVSANTVPRVLLEQRHRLSIDPREPADADHDTEGRVSPLVVLAIIGVMIGMFAAIVLTT